MVETAIYRVKQHAGKAKFKPMALDDTLRSYDEHYYL